MVSGCIVSVEGERNRGQDRCYGQDETFARNERSSCGRRGGSVVSASDLGPEAQRVVALAGAPLLCS